MKIYLVKEKTMKYKDYPTKKQLSAYIVNELEKTVSKLKVDGLQIKSDLFKVPKARRSDLISKQKELTNKYKLIKKGKLWI